MISSLLRSLHPLTSRTCLTKDEIVSIPIDSFSNDSVFDIQAEGTPFGLNGVGGISAFCGLGIAAVYGGRAVLLPFSAGGSHQTRLRRASVCLQGSQPVCILNRHVIVQIIIRLVGRFKKIASPYRLIRLRGLPNTMKLLIFQDFPKLCSINACRISVISR